MVFESITKISNKEEFLEKILIYIRSVEVIAERYGFVPLKKVPITDDIISEMISMGVISSKKDLPALKSLIKSLYHRLLSCVDSYLQNKEHFGTLLYRLSNSKRKELQEIEQNKEKPTIADFFAGAGGLSNGFTQAGYKICFANDFDEVCVRTYRFNHPELPKTKVIEGDIRKIVDNIQDYITQDVDVVIGGPPCQGFSSANQQRIIDDPRNELYKYYVQAVRQLLPKFVVMENVKGMLKVADQVVEDFADIKEEKNGIVYSYAVSYKLMNSAEFSVAQSRERLIYIAIRNDIMQEKKISPQNIFKEIDDTNRTKPRYLLKDALYAIKPLEAPRIKNTNEIDDDRTGKKIDVNTYAGDENEYLRLINGGRVIPILYNHKARYVNDVNYDIYRLLNQGDDASDPKIAGIMPYANRLHCFKDKYYKLRADRPSRTITAHLKMDCHSHIHPFEIRAITPREAARCQSFPDDYVFLGAYLKTYMQIGNAVPCLMAKGIAEIIKKYI